MKSKLSIILVIVLISTFIAGCSDNPEEKSYYEIDPLFEEDKKPESINLIGNNEESREYFENELAMKSLMDTDVVDNFIEETKVGLMWIG
ncbi:MAG: hypothetical protein SCJ93_12100 [Bacillota bacterium]|nr:hypothetical protein [Bacillota bacterium]